MAFQIFDDVAFYFACVCLFAVVLIPYTLWIGAQFLLAKYRPSDKTGAESACECAECVAKAAHLRVHGEKGSKKRKWGIRHVLFIAAWIGFAYLVLQLPSMQGQNMTTFNPYDIVGVASDATDAEIKRAYRKKALELHPDRNPDDPDGAAAKFQLLAKAMETLADPASRTKWDETGESGQYTRMTGSIGLPSWLTEKKNEVPVLLLYFMLMILLPPICVYLWWRDARNYHDTGVLNQSVGHFFNFLKEDHSVKFLIETLATAWEYRALEDNQPVGPDVDKLLKTLKDAKAAGSGQVKAKLNRPYIVKANALLHAYLMRLPIPDSLIPDLRLVLKDAHRLLNVMLEISLSRLYLRPSLAIIDLQQMITQALWVHKSPLLQLPYFDEQDVRASQRKGGITSLVAFKKADEDKKKSVFSKTDAEWKNINAVAASLPAIAVTCSYEVADEKGVYEGDIITLNVKLTRLRDLSSLTESETSSISMEGGEEDGDGADDSKVDKRDRRDKRKELKETAEADKPSSPKGSVASSESKEVKHDSALTAPSDTAEAKEIADRKARGDASRADFEKKESSIAHLSEEQRIERLALSAPREKESDAETAPIVHCPRFPFVKRERWTLLLVERGIKTRIIAKTKSANFDDKAEFPLTFRAPRAGTTVYEVHAKCDSYVGVDQIKSVPLRVEPRPAQPLKLRELESESDEEDEEETEGDKEEKEEESAPGKWYYFGMSSFWELAGNVVVLLVLFFFAKEFLQSRGYWQRYVTPVLDVVTHIVGPPAKTIYGFIAPVADPVVGAVGAAVVWLGQKLHSPVDPAELKAKRKRNQDDY